MNVRTSAGTGPRTAKSRGYTISYEDSGLGSPVVLIPGFMQSAADVREAGYVERLAGQRVVILDPLGHGKSDKPHEAAAYHQPDIAADVIAVLDAAGLDRAVLWGYSRGAWLACMAAIEFPHRLTALILGGRALTQPPPTDIPPWVDPLLRGDWPGVWSLFPTPLDAEVKRHYERNDPKALAAERIGRIESPYVFDLDRISVPALVYCGGEDEPDDVVPTAQALKTELIVVEGYDHHGGFHAVDSVVPIVATFLRTVASA